MAFEGFKDELKYENSEADSQLATSASPEIRAMLDFNAYLLEARFNKGALRLQVL